MCNRYLMVFAYAYKMVKYSHIRRTEIIYLKESSIRKPYNYSLYALVLEWWRRCQVLRLGNFRHGIISRYPAEELIIHGIPGRFGVLLFGLKIAEEKHSNSQLDHEHHAKSVENSDYAISCEFSLDYSWIEKTTFFFVEF